jgi:hypothetical protein
MADKGEHRSAYLRVIAIDNSIPIDQAAVDLWLKDLDNRLRWFVRPLLQFVFAILLHVIWFLKRLPLPQFRAHSVLQRVICWFCRNFVSPEANELILRHFATESNVLNFLRHNSGRPDVNAVELYPKTVDGMMTNSFVDHDQELFRVMRELGRWDHALPRKSVGDLDWTNWRPLEIGPEVRNRRWSQVVDFESAHALFMCLFCLLLKRDEYRDAINGFNLDQSIAIRIGQIIGDPSLVELVYNKYPHYLVGPWNLGQRFLMHGFFTEYLHARLEMLRSAAAG